MVSYYVHPNDSNGISLKEAKEYLLSISNTSRIFFRGQSNSKWGLETSFQRALLKMDSPVEGQSINDFYGRTLVDFRDECVRQGYASYRLWPGDKKELINNRELQSLAQHYCLPTMFLDWTKNPYLALFFAFDGCGTSVLSDHELVSVWCLDWNKCLEGAENLLVETENSSKEQILKELNDYHLELIDQYSLLNDRIRQQSGVHTWVKTQDTLIDLIIKKGVSFPENTLVQVNICAAQQKTLLKELALIGIDSASVMADRDGVSKSIYNKNYRF